MSESAQTLDRSPRTISCSPAMTLWPAEMSRSMIQPLAGAKRVTVRSGCPVLASRSICSSVMSQRDSRFLAAAASPALLFSTFRYSCCADTSAGL